MSINYTWDCTRAKVHLEHTDSQSPTNTENNVVHTIMWELTGTDTENTDSSGQPITASISGPRTLDVTNLESFISFNNLTNETATSWVTDTWGTTQVDAFKAQVDALIEKKVNPTDKIIGN